MREFIWWLIPVIGLAIVALAAHLVSSIVYRQMKKSGSTAAVAVRVLTFVGSFVGILAIIWYIIVNNLRIER